MAVSTIDDNRHLATSRETREAKSTITTKPNPYRAMLVRKPSKSCLNGIIDSSSDTNFSVLKLVFPWWLSRAVRHGCALRCTMTVFTCKYKCQRFIFWLTHVPRFELPIERVDAADNLLNYSNYCTQPRVSFVHPPLTI